jgi:pilus assembly protein CpaE
MVAFTSAKPGSGASTLAMQTAFALRRLSGRRTLLADLDLMGGTIGFCLKLNHSRSLADALERQQEMDPVFWSSLTVSHGGLDILPAPEVPRSQSVDPARLQEVLEFARLQYDWIILDLPTVFQRLSLIALTESEQAYLVSTAELPSLHLTRKAVNLLTSLGIGKERFRVVLNRTNKRDGIGGADIEKIFNCSIYARFPNDYFSLHRVVTLGQPLDSDSELGRSIEELAAKLSNGPVVDKGRKCPLMQPALSQS